MSQDRTQAMLTAPITGLLYRMAAPQAAGFLVQASVAIAEIWFIGQLGTEGLAAMALVFPLQMLIQMLSSGGVGGAVTGSTARLLGGGQLDQAEAYIWQVIYMALGLALLSSLVFFFSGEAILIALGGEGAVLSAALEYTKIFFPFCILIWLQNMLLGIVRGTGNMKLPSLLMSAGACLQIVLSGGLILGLGPLPQLGIQGAAISILSIALISNCVLIAYFCKANSHLKLKKDKIALRPELIKDTLITGTLASVSPFFTISTILAMTGLVGRFGLEALAGYGIAARVEMLVMPLVFGFGVSMNALVGTCVGNGLIDRAERIGWIGALNAGAITGSIGIILALFPEPWIRIFTNDAATISVAAQYFKITAPFFACLGIGLALFFGSQGAKAIGWPVVGTVLRFCVAVISSWILLEYFNAGIETLFSCVAIAMLVYAAVNCIALYLGNWRPPVLKERGLKERGLKETDSKETK